MPFDSGLFGSGLGSMLGGLFGHSEKPYDRAMEQYEKYGNLARQQQQPYMQAGQQAIPQYQSWLQGQQDPSSFMNNLMQNYQESPYTNYLQQQAMRAGQNSASADGTMGSSPMMLQQQQNAANISQQGMNDWLKNVLGINTQYGQGQQNLMQGGQNAANNLSQLYSNLGGQMGEAAYGSEAGRQQNTRDMWGGLGSMFGSIPFFQNK